jgi:xanthine dehydrogenase accessory factor
MEEILRETIKGLEKGESVVWATVVEHKGSTPRKAAARMLIRTGQNVLGSVGGGKLEDETLKASATLHRQAGRRLLEVSMTGQDVAESEMICGGEARIFLELLSPDSLPYVRQIHERVSNQGEALLVTWVDDRARSYEDAHFIVQQTALTDEPPGTVLQWAELIRNAIANGRIPGLLALPKGEGFLFVEPLERSPALYIFGGGHISLDLAWIADRVGFRAIVLDDREEFANRERFPMACQVRAAPFKEILKETEIGKDDFVVIVTRGHIHDLDVLREVIAGPARYIGMIGSQRKKKMIFSELLKEGVSQERLDEVHAPIGLDIRAETPAEIAVSIVAEIIYIQRQSLGPGRKEWRV